MTTILLEESRRELAGIEIEQPLPARARPQQASLKKVRRVKPGTCLNQLRDFVSGILSLLENCSQVFDRAEYAYSDVVIIQPQAIVNINENADKSTGANVRTRIQCDVEGLSVRAIDNRNLCGEAYQSLSAVSALLRISLQSRALGFLWTPNCDENK